MEDLNLVELWLRRDPTRWAAGIFAGIFACIAMIAVSMAILKIGGGQDPWFVVKLGALPVLGASAMEYGIHGAALGVGLAVHLVLAIFLGVLYAQFVPTNRMRPLLAMGFVWGVFSWIFIHNLFIQSSTLIFAVQTSAVAAFFIELAFGFSLSSVAFFDRMLRH